MSLQSIFQIFQLAIGPSLPYTTGALKVGQYFRELLLGVPYHQDNRVLIELLGSFSEKGKLYHSDKALIAGLGGFVQGETRMNLQQFFGKLNKAGGFQLLNKTWPLNASTDIVFNTRNTDIPHSNTIRFHLLSADQTIILQSEYTVSPRGLVSGPGSRDSLAGSNIEQVSSYEEICKICELENLDLYTYVLTSEKTVHAINQQQIFERMVRTWQILKSSAENGLSSTLVGKENSYRTSPELYNEFKEKLVNDDFVGSHHTLAGIFGMAVCEESIDNQIIITSPDGETSGILAGTLLSLAAKFKVSEEQVTKALTVAGFFGSILLNVASRYYDKVTVFYNLPVATAMAAVAGSYLLNKNPEFLGNCAKNAILLSDWDLPEHSNSYLMQSNYKHANLALEAINMSLAGYSFNNTPFDKFFGQELAKRQS